MAYIVPITDFNAPALDIYARLTEVQLLNREHPEEGLFIAESPKVTRKNSPTFWTAAGTFPHTPHPSRY